MPFYHANVRPGLLDRDGREAFSKDVVEVHCGATGAPPSFVHVLVTENDGGLPESIDGAISATIRAGRTDEQKQGIYRDLRSRLAGHMGVDVEAVTATSRDIGASYTMEGGELLPEPGSPEEAAWK